MKKILGSLVFLVSLSSLSARILIDKIVAKVNGSNILMSDLQKPQMSKNGLFFSLQEAVNHELIFQKAVERKLLPTQTDVEKQIVALKIQNGIADVSDEEFKKSLEEEGFTVPEYKNQLAKMLAVERLKQMEFSEKVVVTSQEVEDFLNNDYGKAIITNSSVQILMKQSPAAIETIGNTFYLSQGEKNLLLSCEIGSGLFFAGNNHVFMKVTASPEEHQIITSDPKEIIARQQAESTKLQTPKFK